MESAAVIVMHLTKSVFELHGAGYRKPLFRSKLTRGQLRTFLASYPSTILAMEACASSHYCGARDLLWARRFDFPRRST